MRILVFSPIPTHPPEAGHRARILGLVQALRQAGHEVHVALAATEPFDFVAMNEFLGPGRLHIISHRIGPPKMSLSAKVRRRLNPGFQREMKYYWALDDWYDAAITPQLKALQHEHRFDVVVVEYVFLSAAFDAFPDVRMKVLDTHDCFGDRHKRYLAAGEQPAWYSTTQAEEVRGFRRADIVLAIQPDEAADFARRLGEDGHRVRVVGHLLDLSRRARPTDSLSATFLASANPINVRAAEYFISRVLPLIRDREPDFELIMAGDVCSAVGSCAGVRKVGRVPHFADAFEQAPISVVPLQMGTGMSIKLLDAMAAGVPVVSTASGARGLGDAAHGAVWVVPDDDANAFAAALLTLLHDDVRRNHMAASARLQAEAWNRDQVKTLVDMLQSVGV